MRRLGPDPDSSSLPVQTSFRFPAAQAGSRINSEGDEQRCVDRLSAFTKLAKLGCHSGIDDIADIRAQCQHLRMIAPANMFEPILEADPTFASAWNAFSAEYAEAGELPLYILLSELAVHLIDRKRRGDVAGFHEIFAVVERWHTEGDDYVSEAATIGFLESLQNQLRGNRRSSDMNGVLSADFELYFGPETQRWWRKLDRFWKGDTSALSHDT